MCAAARFASVESEGAWITAVVFAISVRQDFRCSNGHHCLTLFPTSSGTVGPGGPGGLKPTGLVCLTEAEVLGPVEPPVEPPVESLVEQLVAVKATRTNAIEAGPVAR